MFSLIFLFLHDGWLRRIAWIITLSGALILFNLGGLQTAAANPLTGQTPDQNQAPPIVQKKSLGVVSGLVKRITLWQMQLKQKVASQVRSYKTDGRIGPLLPLFLIALAYGAIHAAGPGHGKAVAMTYALAHGRSYGAGFLLGGLIALIHAGSAVLLVFMLRLVLAQSTSGSLDSISQTTQVVSYGLITLIGLFLFISSIPEWFNKADDSNTTKPKQRSRIVQSPLAAAFAIGIVPCPGIIMILLFCLSLDQMVLGFLLAIALSIGMAITITLAVCFSLAGKRLTLRVSSRWQDGISYAERALHSASGLLLTCISGLFLTAAL